MALGFFFLVIIWPIWIGISEILYRSRQKTGFFFELFVASVICASPLFFSSVENINLASLITLSKSLVIPCAFTVACTEFIYRFTSAGSGKKHLAQIIIGLIVAVVWPGIVTSISYGAFFF